jgi:Uma2 family endonuclease
MVPVLQVKEVHYPESDGRPMGETDLHRDAMIRTIELLKHHFRGQKVYVSGDLLVYYEQGNPKKFVIPDAFVVKDREPRRRRIWKIWVEGKGPDVVIETTSRKTKRKDLMDKPAVYAHIGVKEYFLFDPEGDYLDPPLQGHRLTGGSYSSIQPDATGALVSEELGLRLRVEGGELMLYRLDTGERLLTAEERTAQAEAELARLREQLKDRGEA